MCDEIATLKSGDDWNAELPQKVYVFDKMPSDYVLLDFDTCLTNKELLAYGNGKKLYGWHISDLVIYDKPRELREFKYACTKKFACEYDCTCGVQECKYKVPDRVPFECAAEISRPPQSWCYVEEV